MNDVQLSNLRSLLINQFIGPTSDLGANLGSPAARFGQAHVSDVLAYGTSLMSNINPRSNNTFDLGTGAVRWRNLFLSGDLNISGDVVTAGLLDGVNLSEMAPIWSGKAEAVHSHAAGDVTDGVFADARIPNLNASKITAGVFADARIPSLDASKTTSGTFHIDRIPNIPAAKVITSDSATFVSQSQIDAWTDGVSAGRTVLRAYRTSNLSRSDGEQDVPMNVYATLDGTYNSTTGAFTVYRTGYYLLNACVTMNAPSTGQYELYWYVNGVKVGRAFRRTLGDYEDIRSSVIVHASVGQTIHLKMGFGQASTVIGARDATHYEIAFLGFKGPTP